MKSWLSDRRRQFLTVALSVLMLLGWAHDLRAADREPLNILLTNDDGFDAPGIKTVYEVLVAAGHNVTLVAPLTNQSASGARFTPLGVLHYAEHSTAIWTVDGSPGDAVRVGLGYILKDSDRPDLVISGANLGQNLGYASSSGTVGAAITAVYMGVPAIAVSVGVDLSEWDATPIRFPSTISAFEGAASLTLRLVDDLQRFAVDTEKLLPEHTILNVNYPAVGADELRGVRVAQAARSYGGHRFFYEDSEQNGQLEVKVEFDRPTNEGDSETDVELFSDGYATITILDGDWDAGMKMREAVLRRLPEIVEQKTP